jgi:hypothetical protein
VNNNCCCSRTYPRNTKEKFDTRKAATQRALIWLNAKLNPKKRKRNDQRKPAVPRSKRPTRNTQSVQEQGGNNFTVDRRRNNSGIKGNKGNTKSRKRTRGQYKNTCKLSVDSQTHASKRKTNRSGSNTNLRMYMNMKFITTSNCDVHFSCMQSCSHWLPGLKKQLARCLRHPQTKNWSAEWHPCSTNSLHWTRMLFKTT